MGSPHRTVLDIVIEEAEADPHILGLILHGSHGPGMADEESDYDLIAVLTDEAFARKEARRHWQRTEYGDGRKLLEMDPTCPSRLSRDGVEPWLIQGLATARILLDKTGDIATALEHLLRIPRAEIAPRAAELFDGYLNCFYRSVKAARRGNELGARLQAAESLIYLSRTLFTLAGRLTPFHDRLPAALDSLSDQGWEPGELQHLILDVLRSGDIQSQVALEERVEAMMRFRGYGHVVESWDGEIERVKGFVNG